MGAEYKVLEEYRGYQIGYFESWAGKSSIVVKHEGSDSKSVESLSSARAWVDAQLKKLFKKIPVISYFVNGLDEMQVKKGEITSVIDDKHVWVAYPDGRKKELTESLLVDTEENVKILAEYKEMVIRRKNAMTIMNELRLKMGRVNVVETSK